MGAVSISKAVRMSPRKVSVVASLVRGRTLSDALTILDHTPRRSALYVRKAIQSAGANAENNHNYKPDTLYIAEISVTADQRYKRYRPAARGRALPFQRKTSHIRVVVEGDKRQPKKPKAVKEAK